MDQPKYVASMPLGACANCRRQKQKCDRKRPDCSRCISKLLHCSYNTEADTSVSPAHGASMTQSPPPPPSLITYESSCSFDLSAWGEHRLRWAANNGGDPSPAPLFSGIPEGTSLSTCWADVLDAARISPSVILERYFSTVHSWLPIVDEEIGNRLLRWIDLSERWEPVDSPSSLLLLCMHILTQKPCGHANHSMSSRLYQIIRHSFLSAHVTDRNITLVQSGLLLATYELGHGLLREAYATLGVCLSYLQWLNVDRNSKQDQIPIAMCCAAMVLLDRSITLCIFDNRIPLLIQPGHVLAMAALRASLENHLVSADPKRQLLARGLCALRIGEQLGAFWASDDLSVENARMALRVQLEAYIMMEGGQAVPVREVVAMSLGASAMLSCGVSESGVYLKCEDTRRSIETMTLDACHAEADILRSSGFTGGGNSLFLGIICLYSSAVQLVRLGRQGVQSAPTEQGGVLTAQELEIAPLLKDLSRRWKIGDTLYEQLVSTANR